MFKKLIYLLSPSEQKTMYLLFVMILFMALIDMIGVASIMPFIAVLSNPEIIETNLMVKSIFNFSSIFGVETKNQFFFFLGVTVLFLIVCHSLSKHLLFIFNINSFN